MSLEGNLTAVQKQEEIPLQREAQVLLMNNNNEICYLDFSVLLSVDSF